MSLRAKAVNRTSAFPQGTPDIKTRATAEAWSKKGHSYKPLPIRFRRDGFNYRQIARSKTPRYTSKRGAVVLMRVFVTR